MTLPVIIQGGMGVAISDWRLARRVSQLGQLGVVSGTGLSRIMVARLMNGDLDGHTRRALAHFPNQEAVERILAEYFVEGGKPANQPYKNVPAYSLKPTKSLDAITVIANFVEVFLAKEGHDGQVGMNLLEKVQLPNLASLYGALLAGVDYILMGAGIPIQIPGALDHLARHEATSYRVDVAGAGAEDDYRIHFDPNAVFPDIAAQVGQLKRPAFLPIISSVVLAQALLKRSEGSIEGFIVEGPLAGGHNAPPRGAVQLNERGEPIYTTKDEVDLAKIAAIGLPFWLAGNYGSHDGLRAAIELGATGIQVGTAFAYCTDSGMAEHLREAALERVITERADVRTHAKASPTGFPFKVVELDGTLTESEIYSERDRICDMGFLRTIYKRPDGKIGYRCPAEPIEDYLRKGGDLDDTEERVCLCNALGAAAGFPQLRVSRDAPDAAPYVEKALVTAGNDLLNIGRFLKDGQTEYSAEDVIRCLLVG